MTSYPSTHPRAIRKHKLKQRFGNRLDETIKHTQEKLDLLKEIKEDFKCPTST